MNSTMVKLAIRGNLQTFRLYVVLKSVCPKASLFFGGDSRVGDGGLNLA